MWKWTPLKHSHLPLPAPSLPSRKKLMLSVSHVSYKLTPCRSEVGECPLPRAHGQPRVSVNFRIFFKCVSGKTHSTVDSNRFYAIKCPPLKGTSQRFWHICTFVQPQLRSRYRTFLRCKKVPKCPLPRKPPLLAAGDHRSASCDDFGIVSLHSSMMSEAGLVSCVCEPFVSSFVSAPRISGLLLDSFCFVWVFIVLRVFKKITVCDMSSKSFFPIPDFFFDFTCIIMQSKFSIFGKIISGFDIILKKDFPISRL